MSMIMALALMGAVESDGGQQLQQVQQQVQDRRERDPDADREERKEREAERREKDRKEKSNNCRRNPLTQECSLRGLPFGGF